jgi:hypothetical protein
VAAAIGGTGTIPVYGVWGETSLADFASGTNNSTQETNVSGGEVQLRAAFNEDFSGTALSTTAWKNVSLAPLGGGPTSVGVSGGNVSVAGAIVLSKQTFNLIPIEGRVSFGATPFQYFGMSTDFTTGANSVYWAAFTTGGTNNTLFAEVNANMDIQQVSLGAIPTGFHTYQVEPISGGFNFYIDDALKATIMKAVPTSAGMKAVLSNYFGGSQPTLQAAWVHELNYASVGTYTSSVFDAGRAVNWGAVNWTASLPAGTSIIVEVRTGNTANPDSSWSSWSAVADGGVVGGSSRFLQYRIRFVTTDPTATGTLFDISFFFM